MGTGMKSLKLEGIGTKNLFPHTSSFDAFKMKGRRKILLVSWTAKKTNE